MYGVINVGFHGPLVGCAGSRLSRDSVRSLPPVLLTALATFAGRKDS